MITFILSPAFAALALSATQVTATGQAESASEPTEQAVLNQADIAGEYRDRSSFEMFHGLLLREDGTFEWAISVGAMDRRSSGTWAINGAEITLTTTPTPVAPEFAQAESSDAADAPFLQVSWPNGNGIAGINFTLLCADGKQISHYTQENGWDLVPGECDEPLSISLTESIHEVGPAYFDLEGQTGGLRFTLVPGDFGVEDMTGSIILQTEDGILLGLRGDFVEMVRVDSDQPVSVTPAAHLTVFAAPAAHKNAGAKKSPASISLTRMEVIRNPEMTKKTSTPAKPPENPATPAWLNRTASTASARSPSMSRR